MPPTEGCDWRKNVRKEDCGYKRAGKRGDWYKELNEGDVGQGYTMWELTQCLCDRQVNEGPRIMSGDVGGAISLK